MVLGGLDRAGFVGRETERAVLAARLQAALAGGGQVVLLAGEPGIGKSRLASEIVAAAAVSGVECRWGRVSADEGSPPYWPFRQVIRPLATPERLAALGQAVSELALVVPEVGEVGHEGGARDAELRFQAFEAVGQVLTAAAEPCGLLVVLDDVQWADPGSLQLLVHVARGLDRARVLLVVIYRDTETGGRTALREALAALGRESVVTRMRLVGLTETEVAAQLAGATGREVPAPVAAAVSRRSQGNPLFVAELGRLLGGRTGGDGGDGDIDARVVEELPAGVRDAVHVRLARLSNPCQEMVSTASVVGPEVDAICLAVLRGRPMGEVLVALDEAVAAGIVTASTGGRFAHDLVREAARLELPTVERLGLHQRIAAYLAGRPDARIRVAEVAFHALESLPVGDPAEAVLWAERAARQAMTQLAWEDAAGLYGRALAVTTGLTAADRCRLLLGQARAQVRAYDMDAARQALLDAADLARTRNDPGTLAEVALVVEGVIDSQWGAISQELCVEALAALPDTDSALRARLVAQLAVHQTAVLHEDGSIRAEPSSAAALAMAERVGDRDAIVVALRARQMACSGPEGATERLALGDRLLALGVGHRDDESVLWGRLWRFEALAQLGEVDQAEAELEPLAAVTARLRSPLARSHLLRSRSAIALARGRFTEARALMEELLALTRRSGDEVAAMISVAHLRCLASFTGEEALLGEPEDGAAVPGPLRSVTAAWHLAVGRRSQARRLSRLIPPLTTTPAAIVLHALENQAQFAAAFDDRAAAAKVHGMLVPFADLFVSAGAGAAAILGSVRLPLGVAAGTLGRLDEAVGYLRAAVEINERAGLPPFAALARYHLARVLARRRRPGDRDEATALVLSAAAVAERLGMAPLLRDARELAASLTGQSAGPLTRREREIAVLVGQGLTNRQIAAAAHISERTAENHVQHILTKLGFATRAQIAAWIASGEQQPKTS